MPYHYDEYQNQRIKEQPEDQWISYPSLNSKTQEGYEIKTFTHMISDQKTLFAWDNNSNVLFFHPNELVNYLYQLPPIITQKDLSDVINKTITHFQNEKSPNNWEMDKFVGKEIKNIEAEFKNVEEIKKMGYVQGVCECVAIIGDDHTLGKKLLTEMNVTKDMAKKYASQETFKTLEQGIFAPKPEQTLEQTQSRGRGI